MKKIFLLLYVVVFGMANFIFGTYAMAASSNFDNGLDGWTDSPTGNISWDNAGGNPGGYLNFNDNTSGATWIIAPEKFLGNWSGLDGTEAISFDHIIIDASDGVGVEFVPYSVFLSGPGGEAVWEGDTPSVDDEGTWIHTVVPLQEEFWDVQAGSWSDMLTDVRYFYIRPEVVSNLVTGSNDIEGIDNVSVVPIPGAIWLLGSAFIGLVGFRKKFRKA